MRSNALAELEFDGKTAKRATWEAFDFDVPTDGVVVVTNASYGSEKDEHVHSVTVEDGVPTSCSCKADEYQPGACKHRVAVAIAEPVLEAASAHPGPAAESSRAVATDGGRPREHCAECGSYLPDEIDEGTGVYCSECGTGQYVTDGGQVLEPDPRGSEAETRLPEITEHVESPRQGGARYIRCEGCQQEVIGTDENRLVHREGCAHAVSDDYALPAWGER